MNDAPLPRPADLALRSRRVVTPKGIVAAWVLVTDGVIQDLLGADADPPPAVETLDIGEATLFPGVVDTHVHVNEPGRAEWEGFEAASRAAVAGGVTTIVDMPLNCSPVTTTVNALDLKTAAARGQSYVDYGLWGGSVPGNLGELKPLHEAGVLGFKCFLVDSGLEEFRPLDARDLGQTMDVLAELGAVLLVHAELPGPIDAAAANRDPDRIGSAASYADYEASRPERAEAEAIELLVDLSGRTGCRVHVVHVSAAESLPLLGAAKEAGIAITAETCPHYLTFTAGDIADGATEFKCAPPIRRAGHRESLWEGLRDRTLDMIASDHSPCPPELKHLATGDFVAAWGGIASLQVSLSATWTEARRRGYDVRDMARWMAEAPSRLAGLGGAKGRIAPGYDADLVVWEPEAEFAVEATGLLHRHSVCPYIGRVLRGRVRQTFVRGRLVFDDGDFPRSPSGRFLAREDA